MLKDNDEMEFENMGNKAVALLRDIAKGVIVRHNVHNAMHTLESSIEAILEGDEEKMQEGIYALRERDKIIANEIKEIDDFFDKILEANDRSRITNQAD